jgi:hypothetical protein
MSSSTPHLVVRLPNGRTRSIPVAATDHSPHSPLRDAPVLLPISARTLLPVARHLHRMAHTREEAAYGSGFPAPNEHTATVTEGDDPGVTSTLRALTPANHILFSQRLALLIKRVRTATKESNPHDQ